MADFERDTQTSETRTGDSFWLVSHVFPKWLYVLLLVCGTFIDLRLTLLSDVQNRYTTLVIASAVVFALLVGTLALDGLLLRRRERLSVPLAAESDHREVPPNSRRTGSTGENSPASDDSPSSFGYKTAWIAVPSKDGRALAESLKLVGIGSCSWGTGIENAHELRGVFVTPPIGGFTIAVGALPEAGDSRFLPTLEALSQTFHQAFYFGTHRVVDYQAWAIAEEGRTRRAFAWLGERGEFLLNVGERTSEEAELGIGMEDLDCVPDEETVLDLAARLVLDPRELEQEHPEASGPGWFGAIGKL